MGVAFGVRMQRRRFLTVLIATTMVWPVATNGQQAMPVIGLLCSASSRDYAPMIAAFLKSLGEAGFVEGRNVKVEYVWADEQYDRLPALAADLVRHQVNVIVAATTPAALALKPATRTIPIVFAIGGDPVRTGLVESLSRPGGNLTGAAHINVETAPKRLELMHELMPNVKVAGLLVNPTNPLANSVVPAVHAAAGLLGLKMQVVYAHNDEELDAVFASLPALGVGALVIGTDPFFTSRAQKLGAASLSRAMPAIYQYREFAAAGGVMSYGGSIVDSYHHAGLYVGRILKGEKPGNLPVQLSTKVELFFNLKSAKALGLTAPLPLLARADEVIE
ncbi:ABC transporter substrate-binding protein [Bradyrhizobium japonicum]|uniref:ABC transporter substrate-binding protein n=1 Tax=Bradyrhizobium japonicum TaxID=375 RepID=UPI0027154E59|nr:ABC transporter substrate-binding protein [Bradyrhizobium japonicum]WLB24217.1 ABC transporter substrate-binding protein [Bradyrhizobium japonicum]